MMNDKQTKASGGWERGLSRIAMIGAGTDEIIDYESKKERNWVAIKRYLIIALSITPVALIIESPLLFYTSYVFFALCLYSIFKGMRIQTKISELRQKLKELGVVMDKNELGFVYAEKVENPLLFRERMFALHRAYLDEEEAKEKRKQVEDDR